jgi:hypothetical protein
LAAKTLRRSETSHRGGSSDVADRRGFRGLSGCDGVVVDSGVSSGSTGSLVARRADRIAGGACWGGDWLREGISGICGLGASICLSCRVGLSVSWSSARTGVVACGRVVQGGVGNRLRLDGRELRVCGISPSATAEAVTIGIVTRDEATVRQLALLRHRW